MSPAFIRINTVSLLVANKSNILLPLVGKSTILTSPKELKVSISILHNFNG